MTELEMVEKFQCPGCVCGSDTNCGRYNLRKDPMEGFTCKSHVIGTSMGGIGHIALGLPKGFNRTAKETQHMIRFYKEMPEYDKFNVPVWAMIKDNILFVRVFMPRVNNTTIDVVENGTIPPNSINVGEFIDQID